MKAVFVLAVVALAALATVSEAGPAKQQKLRSLADVLREAGQETAPKVTPQSTLALEALAGKDAVRSWGCFEPGCKSQCQRYGYPGGYCSWGECMCWY
ncbi:hypothetical protein ONE63_011355 [Megalurothrips usitatus]|uniref:Uncharacterized protein n=1 Tax=Megalurothrips usitatus TaxID=439358 RepID=A0AAV7WZR2_9NEOP|nr:hypothetical protein ONE63_011355 [Megalurothrips usitatus]